MNESSGKGILFRRGVAIECKVGGGWGTNFVTNFVSSLLQPHISCGGGFNLRLVPKYEGWNFNFGNAAVTFDAAHLQSSYFNRPSMYCPKLCRTRSQR